MSRRCRHLWRTLRADYAAPRTLRWENFEGPPDLAEKLVFGMTTVVQSCVYCCEDRAYTVAGDARTTREQTQPNEVPP